MEKFELVLKFVWFASICCAINFITYAFRDSKNTFFGVLGIDHWLIRVLANINFILSLIGLGRIFYLITYDSLFFLPNNWGEYTDGIFVSKKTEISIGVAIILLMGVPLKILSLHASVSDKQKWKAVEKQANGEFLTGGEKDLIEEIRPTIDRFQKEMNKNEIKR